MVWRVLANFFVVFFRSCKKWRGNAYNCTFFDPSISIRYHLVILAWSGFGDLVVSMLASGTQVRGFEPGPSDFSGEKIHNMPSFGVEVKASVPCRRFAACKRSLRFSWKSELQAKLTGHFLAPIPSFTISGLSWAPLEMTGETKGGVQRARTEKA
jgi:hypothetical protein